MANEEGVEERVTRLREMIYANLTRVMKKEESVIVILKKKSIALKSKWEKVVD